MTRQRNISSSSSPSREWRPPVDDRSLFSEASVVYRSPTWQEQKLQYFTRILFWFLAMAFFNLSHERSSTLLNQVQMNVALVIYAGCVFAMFLHAARRHFCPARFRLAMWVDIIIVTIALVNDPYSLPPSELVFIVVVLGNGMRYGMKIFAEALLGSYAGILVSLSIRFLYSGQELSPGLIFLNLFGGIILVYSYILMGRIETNRNQLEKQSLIDPLTGVMNRRALFDRAQTLFHQLERTGKSLVVMFADLDKFKAVNDSFGHSTGDKVLKDFADILHNSVRRYDLVARLGGDEFVLLLPEANLSLAEQTARRIQQTVREYAAAKNMNFSVTFGLGEVPRHGCNLMDILDKVDCALYQSKTIDRQNGITFVTDAPSPPQDNEVVESNE